MGRVTPTGDEPVPLLQSQGVPSGSNKWATTGDIAALGAGGGVQIVIADFSAAEILAGLFTGLEVVPAPGAGFFLNPFWFSAQYTFVTRPYFTGGEKLYYDGVIAGLIDSLTVMNTFVQSIFANGGNVQEAHGNFVISDIENKAIVFNSQDGFDPATVGLIVTSSLGSNTGAGYAPGDTFNIIAAQGPDNTIFTVDTVDGGGAVLTYHISTQGDSGYQTGADFNANTLTGGGVGLLINIDSIIPGDGTLRVTVQYQVVAIL